MINLYRKNEINFTHNGICILRPLKAIVKEELNGDYSLEITMQRGVSDIQNEQIIKAPTPKGNQLFRVYNCDVDMLGNPVFYARHIFYDLLDYFIEDTRPTGNGQVAITRILDNTPFTGTSDITNEGTAYYEMMNPVKAMLGADNSFIEVWGGELDRDNFNISMKNSIGTDRGVSIRYRKNLTGLRLQTDLSEVYTKIMPTGLKADGQTLLKLPEKYVESPLINNYVNIKTTRIHYGDIKIDEETTENQAYEKLRNAVNREFEKGLDKPSINITVEFIPLQDTEEYKDLAVLEKVYLGDIVSIFHEDLNIELEAKVISYEFDVLTNRYNKVILGNTNPKYGDEIKEYIKEQNEQAVTIVERIIADNTQLIIADIGDISTLTTSSQIVVGAINELDVEKENKNIIQSNPSSSYYDESNLEYEITLETATEVYITDKVTETWTVRFPETANVGDTCSLYFTCSSTLIPTIILDTDYYEADSISLEDKVEIKSKYDGSDWITKVSTVSKH